MAISAKRVPLEAIIGRDEMAQRVWDTLADKSIVLTAERRMGKTYLLQKLWGEAERNQQNWVQGWQCVYQDISDCSSALEFVQRILNDVRQLPGFNEKWLTKTTQFLQKFAEPLKVGPLQLPTLVAPQWKEILRSIFADVSNQLPEDRVVFLWDEFPVMLDSIIRQEGGEATAEAILNLLHTLRSEYPRIRMILTGSVGLHHVISKLRHSGYNNPATNDMAVMSVEPLEMDMAVFFAKRRLGEIMPNIAAEELAVAIAQEADRMPFYISEVVKKCRYRQLPMDVDTIRQVVQQALVDVDDGWHMGHYLERIGNYYGVTQSVVVRSILDTVATVEVIGTSEIIQQVQSAQVEPVTEELVRELLKLLERDHYLYKDPQDLKYRFRYSLIQRYWQMQRG